MRGRRRERLGSRVVHDTTYDPLVEQNRCQVGPTILFECPAQIPRSFLRSFSLWTWRDTCKTLDRQQRNLSLSPTNDGITVSRGTPLGRKISAEERAATDAALDDGRDSNRKPERHGQPANDQPGGGARIRPRHSGVVQP